MDKKMIDRINELAHKQKSVGLTEAEKAEQAVLRKEYIEAFRKNLKSVIRNIDILEADGTVTEMSKVIDAKERAKS